MFGLSLVRNGNFIFSIDLQTAEIIFCISFKGMPHAPHYFLFQYSYFERIPALSAISLLDYSQHRAQRVVLDVGSALPNFSLSPNFCPSFNAEFQVPCKLLGELGWFRGVNKSPVIMANISDSCSN